MKIKQDGVRAETSSAAAAKISYSSSSIKQVIYCPKTNQSNFRPPYAVQQKSRRCKLDQADTQILRRVQ